MKVLLDTHTFIWWDSDAPKLSPQARAACQDRANLVLLSVASVWEMQIKLQMGKLHLRLDLADVVGEQQQTNDIQVLPVALGHVLALQNLSAHHKDPFDRLLIAQANAEEAVLISHDPVFAHYPVKVLWWVELTWYSVGTPYHAAHPKRDMTALAR